MTPYCSITLRACTGLLALALAGAASAHAILVPPKAEAGSFYKAGIGITHGCGGSATREVIVTIPAGVAGAKPMPKPGWTLEVERSKLAQPRVSHGRSVTEDVTQVRWSGGTLPNAYYDEFVIVATLPDAAAPLYWKVTQICDQGRIDWTDIPADGQAASELKSPAPRLELTPASHTGHHH